MIYSLLTEFSVKIHADSRVMRLGALVAQGKTPDKH